MSSPGNLQLHESNSSLHSNVSFLKVNRNYHGNPWINIHILQEIRLQFQVNLSTNKIGIQFRLAFCTQLHILPLLNLSSLMPNIQARILHSVEWINSNYYLEAAAQRLTYIHAPQPQSTLHSNLATVGARQVATTSKVEPSTPVTRKKQPPLHHFDFKVQNYL